MFFVMGSFEWEHFQISEQNKISCLNDDTQQTQHAYPRQS